MEAQFVESYRRGHMDRREFMASMMAVGVTAFVLIAFGIAARELEPPADAAEDDGTACVSLIARP